MKPRALQDNMPNLFVYIFKADLVPCLKRIKKWLNIFIVNINTVIVGNLTSDEVFWSLMLCLLCTPCFLPVPFYYATRGQQHLLNKSTSTRCLPTENRWYQQMSNEKLLSLAIVKPKGRQLCLNTVLCQSSALAETVRFMP